ncbi:MULTISPECIES: hypothetical protein [unclassified Treponema]|uniref:hypothetical protein n=1 Tax=unclassified Treponema TaxID=2638727 RepID=UPI0020A526CD|nr:MULTISPECIES: hypothetical protein [unclassified Treponema]UTC68152.1 hypothetical protein E4O06_05825 [Treponema sp. OMZ 789]UTC70874.1 hypothetical protein E4O01_05970 [Treponema sp. OMZ 790]UTC73614.1 hypothetical protein E4O02_06165 [Treponema sp. OMZ 791]
MNIKLNGQEIDLKFDTETTIGDVLGNIEEVCRKQKNTITQVCADGKELTLSQLDELFTKSLQEDITIELFTTSGDDIKELLKELGQIFIKNSEEIEQIPIKVQTGNDMEVIKTIEEFSLNLAKLYETAKLFDIADIPNDLNFGEMTLGEYQKEISSNLDAIINAIEGIDTVEISDIAEYELAPLVKKLGNGLLSIKA